MPDPIALVLTAEPNSIAYLIALSLAIQSDLKGLESGGKLGPTSLSLVAS